MRPFTVAIVVFGTLWAADGVGETWYLPVAAGTCAGRPCARQTQIELFNPTGSVQSITLSAPHRGKLIHRTVRLTPGEPLSIHDARTLFESETDGPIAVRAEKEIVVRSALFDSASTAGLREQIRFLPVAESEAIARGESLTIRGLAKGSDGAQSWLHLSEVRGRPLRLEVRIRSVREKDLVTQSVVLQPLETRHLTTEQMAIVPQSDLIAQIEVLEGDGRLVGAATIVNLATGDGVARSAVPSRSPGTDDVEPGRRRSVLSAPPLRGKLELQLVMPVPPEARAAVLDQRSALTAAGITLSPDAAEVEFPTVADGWTVALGNQAAATDAEGFFELPVISGGPTAGEIFSPRVPTPLATFVVRDLMPTSAGAYPPLLRVRLPFAGPCSMGVPPGTADLSPVLGRRRSECWHPARLARNRRHGGRSHPPVA